MAAVNYPITGPPLPSPRPADGSVPLRLELRDLQKNHPDQWNLYLLGLDAFQKQKETDDLSYYGIAGIHGRPYRSWGDKTSTDGDDSAEWQGYCTHSSILFAPWHRPYLALYEQVLYGIIQKIAASFPDSNRARYVQAASTFRIPYWDWAAVPPSDDQYFPNSVGSTAINVITPQSNGKTVTIPNPLYTYHFDPINPERNDFPPNDIHSKWKTTLRYPSSLRSASATSEESMVFEAMQSQFDSLQNNVNLLMNDPNYKKFAAFSNHQWAPDAAPGTYGSLENVHDSIHGEVGGNGGQMGDLDYAAFDPVFWLHHANVDRLFAIWQGLNETSYEINKPDPRGTFTIASNTVETVKTALTPFKDFSGTKFWDSEGVRQTETLAYAYTETQKWKFATTDAYKNDIRTEVQRLYGGISNEFVSQAQIVGNSDVSAQQFIAQDQPSTEGDASRGGEDFEAEIAANAANPAPVSTVPTKDSSFTLYIANIRAHKHILGQTYRVHFFLGDFDENPSTWHTQVPLVGTFVSLSRTLSTNTTTNNNETNGKTQKHCSKCAEDSASNLSITGTVPLTSSLLSALKQGDLGSLELENVIPFLTKELHWRVTLADGTEIPAENVGGLCVSVVSTEVTVPAGGGFPVYSGVYRVHYECTVGKGAGYGGEGA